MNKTRKRQIEKANKVLDRSEATKTRFKIFHTLLDSIFPESWKETEIKYVDVRNI